MAQIEIETCNKWSLLNLILFIYKRKRRKEGRDASLSCYTITLFYWNWCCTLSSFCYNHLFWTTSYNPNIGNEWKINCIVHHLMLQYFTLSSHFLSLLPFLSTLPISPECSQLFSSNTSLVFPSSCKYPMNIFLPLRHISIRAKTIQLDLCTRNYLTDWKLFETSCIGVGRIKVVSLYGFMYMYTHGNVHLLAWTVHAGSASSFTHSIHLTQCNVKLSKILSYCSWEWSSTIISLRKS